MIKEWQQDLDQASIEREASLDVKERVDLPEIGQSIQVTFLSEPRKVSKEDTHLDRDMFVADVDDGSQTTKQIICSKSIRQHLAAMLERGDIDEVAGATVTISAQRVPEFTTHEGKRVRDAKVYRVTLASSS